MKTILALLLPAFFLPALLCGQSIAEMEAKLNRAATPKAERLTLSYTLAEKLLGSNPAKAADYAHRASLLASELKDNRREVGAVMLSAEGHWRKRSTAEANARFNRAYTLAKSYGMNDAALDALGKLQDVATKSGNYRDAYKWSQEAVTLLRGGKTGGSSVGNDPYRARLENQVSALEADNRQLREQLAQATGRTELLETNYRQTESALKEAREQTESELGKKSEELAQVSEQKQRADSLIRRKEALVLNLTKDQIADSLMLAKREKELETQKKLAAQAELDKQASENIRNLTMLVAAFVLVLAVLFFIRYLAKKRTANELAQKNAQIEEQKSRSDNLLLNILPPAVAEELKTKSRVRPQYYENATVMFIDFKGFTTVSERLSPEILVEEIDYCFSNFDRIIGQYQIEKIKTIGDAYMCASGLSDKNASPTDMVRAALEIQDFLLHLKAERMSRNLPYFEARIGIHTGPVVAGVVGTKKFAYDIWGDTVNIAARMEQNSEPGKVNVSETAYWLAKYDFEWQSRGKIAAKNKGMIDMYYVTAMK
ncbi:MAG: adenylate/guanylate cyclase domain-containing protein [Saprospiraceae bacterium]